MKTLLLSLVLLIFPAATQAMDPVARPFKLQDAAGNQVALPSHEKGVDVYLFWASWCPYCKAFMPHLQSIGVEYGDAVRIYALEIRDDANPQAFMADHGYDFVLLPDADSVMDLYGVKGTPGLFLVDAAGRIRFSLYDLIIADNEQIDALSHRQKAARRAPYWAAQVRVNIDEILAGSKP